ncbi:hypothetical protein OS493_020803 [Desmophyllum pertusum]|uniref:Uncharacterized protein n=1 Tax=Desmophyllum pertusum TaxID=174260 RepID=A0A9W9YEL2_9CNID|nr:hypothetical protein OS493_020803 [Desmophyllum pertusum]
MSHETEYYSNILAHRENEHYNKLLPSSKWRNGSFAINEKMTSLGKTLIGYVNQSMNCTVSMIQELLMKMEDRVRLFLRGILNTPATVLQPYFNKFIELHGVIITNISKTLNVPDPLEASQSQGFFSLPHGSIDIKNGRLGIVIVVFKFEELCNDTRDLELDSSETKRQVVGN